MATEARETWKAAWQTTTIIIATDEVMGSTNDNRFVSYQWRVSEKLDLPFTIWKIFEF
jgi:hypothetical protein